MTRSSNTDKTHRLNAAFTLLEQGYTLAEALTRQFGLSRKQAYRYLSGSPGNRCASFGRFTVYYDHHPNTCGCREATSLSCANQRHDYWRDRGICHRQFSRQAAPPLLTKELARYGVDRVFIKAPHSGIPEDQLLLQFQGM